jgi:tetratricopeptide (TPR) repeat protein
MQYRLLLYMSPEDPGPRNELAMALYRTNQLEAAEKELRYILEKDSRNFDALDGLGIVLIKMGRYQDALQYLKKAASVNDQDLMVYVHLSVVYEKLKIPEKSQKELEKARSLTSDPLQLENIEKEFKLVSSR